MSAMAGRRQWIVRKLSAQLAQWAGTRDLVALNNPHPPNWNGRLARSLLAGSRGRHHEPLQNQQLLKAGFHATNTWPGHRRRRGATTHPGAAPEHGRHARWGSREPESLVRETVLLHATLSRSDRHVQQQPACDRLGSKLASCPSASRFSACSSRTDNVNVVKVCGQIFTWPQRILHLLQRRMLSQRVQRGHEGISLLAPSPGDSRGCNHNRPSSGTLKAENKTAKRTATRPPRP